METLERKHGLLDADVALALLGWKPLIGETLAQDQPARDLGQRDAGRLRHEGDGARGAGIGLDHIEALVVDEGELDVQEAYHVQPKRQLTGLMA